MPLNFLHGAEIIQLDDGPRPIQTVRMSTVGIIGTAPAADAAKFPLNTPVMIYGSASVLATLGLTGTLPDAIRRIFHYAGALICVVRVADNVDIDTQLSNLVGSAGTFTGVHAFLRAKSTLGFAPRLLLAPGFTTQRPTSLANPVMTALLGVANKLKAMIYADAPSTTSADAHTWRDDWTSDRIYAFAPMVKVWDSVGAVYVDKPASPSIVGTQVWLDNNKGFHYSPSNKVLTDIGGVSRPIDFTMGDPDCEANVLNEDHINTIIHEGGWRSWGNRTTSIDTNWIFASSRRIADAIDDSILAAALPWIDEPLRPAIITSIVESVNGYLRVLQREGAIVGGKAWFDPDRNTAAELKLGHLHVEYDREPAAPIERLTYGARRNQTYYSTLVQDVMSEISRASALAA